MKDRLLIEDIILFLKPFGFNSFLQVSPVFDQSNCYILILSFGKMINDYDILNKSYWFFIPIIKKLRLKVYTYKFKKFGKAAH